jgi:DNA-directed RNA polymerase subunit RPC12/RpoP
MESNTIAYLMFRYRVCPNCKATVDSSYDYCPYCGYRLKPKTESEEEKEQSNQTPQTGESKPAKTIPSILAIILIALSFPICVIVIPTLILTYAPPLLNFLLFISLIPLAIGLICWALIIYAIAKIMSKRKTE